MAHASARHSPAPTVAGAAAIAGLISCSRYAEGCRMSIDAHAFWVVAPGRGEIRRETPAPPSASDVVVRTLYSGISRGTESLVFHGRVPPSEYQRMRAPFQQGDFPAP